MDSLSKYLILLFVVVLSGCNESSDSSGESSSSDEYPSGTNVAAMGTAFSSYDESAARFIVDGDITGSGSAYWAGNFYDYVAVSLGGIHKVDRIRVYSNITSTSMVQVLASSGPNESLESIDHLCPPAETPVMDVFTCTLNGAPASSVGLFITYYDNPTAVQIREIQVLIE